jgi:hypothetical protein
VDVSLLAITFRNRSPKGVRILLDDVTLLHSRALP